MRSTRRHTLGSLSVLLAAGLAAAGLMHVDAAAQAAPTFACEPQQATADTGTTHTMTCDLTSGQQGLGGVEIDGETLAGSAHDADGTASPPDFSAITNSAGRTTFSYSASTAGTDTICFWRDSDQIDDNIDEGNLQCTEDTNTDRIIVSWYAPQGTPSPTPTPAPSSSGPLLTVTRSGDGVGTVTSTPAGIDCGSDCSESYAQSTEVTLTAEGNVYSDFTGWAGACTSSTGDCIVTMSEAKSVDAHFTARRLDMPVHASWIVGLKTRVRQLKVLEVPDGVKVQVRCSGHGCPFTSKTGKTPGMHKPTVNLQTYFVGHKLRVGAVVEIRITSSDAIGKVVRFTMRRNRVPSRSTLCMPPGGSPHRC